jgi:hypothetical protein
MGLNKRGPGTNRGIFVHRILAAPSTAGQSQLYTLGRGYQALLECRRWIACNRNRGPMFLLAACFSEAHRPATTTRMAGSRASRSVSLVSSYSASRLYTNCLIRGTNRCWTLRPPRLSCRQPVALSVSLERHPARDTPGAQHRR